MKVSWFKFQLLLYKNILNILYKQWTLTLLLPSKSKVIFHAFHVSCYIVIMNSFILQGMRMVWFHYDRAIACMTLDVMWIVTNITSITPIITCITTLGNAFVVLTLQTISMFYLDIHKQNALCEAQQITPMFHHWIFISQNTKPQEV